MTSLLDQHDTTAVDDALEPLDVIGLRPAFHSRDTTPTKRTIQPINDRSLEETPTTAAISLPTPNIDHRNLHIPRAYGDVSLSWHTRIDNAEVFMEVDATEWGAMPSICQAPNAPLMKDLDSFTEGTGFGSFDFSLPSSPRPSHSHLNHPLTTDACPVDYSSRFIETWRDDVLINTASIVGDELTEPSGTLNSHDPPRGLKRHLSWAFSEAEKDSGAERARERWAILVAKFNETQPDIIPPTTESLYCCSVVEELADVSDVAPVPPRSASAPPFV